MPSLVKVEKPAREGRTHTNTQRYAHLVSYLNATEETGGMTWVYYTTSNAQRQPDAAV